MILSRMTPCQVVEIWQPRWRDKTILIAKHKVGTHNKVTFKQEGKFKTPQYPDTYYLSGETIRKYPLDTNGKIPCYAVSLDELEILERE